MKNKEKDKKKKELKDIKEHKTEKNAAKPAKDFSDEIKRLNRVVGQVEGISKMLEDGRTLEDVLIQCKAVHSALKSIESRVLAVHVAHVMDELAALDKSKSREQRVEQLQTLFKQS